MSLKPTLYFVSCLQALVINYSLLYHEGTTTKTYLFRLSLILHKLYVPVMVVLVIINKKDINQSIYNYRVIMLTKKKVDLKFVSYHLGHYYKS